ncbi:50S ribosomal protein P1 [Candidatus Nitrosotenuis chungbukensis]|jgi:large subunit ribosomal protein L12|uniref:50S ribosomal protein P1 n=1 Tax=Candidatus Nitrosotenuis chungbukensis TaxID=1353246 RepID=UPI0005B258E9|nr:50S ribosomal protein P1 [Candidatus Nitrosotenuis chungbukensis]WKT58824.1 50S ribosomal protein P1 [Candidatus Nitrosotenuis chungbukensis]
MEYVYAALILHKLKKEINEANITSIIKATGESANDAQVKALVSALADVNIEEAIKAAPVAVAAAPAAAAAPAGGGDAKKDEAAAGKSEEQAMEGLASLFG